MIRGKLKMIKRSDDVELNSEEPQNISKAFWNGHEDSLIAQKARSKCQAFLHARVMEQKWKLRKLLEKAQKALSDNKFSNEDKLKYQGRMEGLEAALIFLESLEEDFALFTGYKITEDEEEAGIENS
jgi:hypothetical protein